MRAKRTHEAIATMRHLQPASVTSVNAHRFAIMCVFKIEVAGIPLPGASRSVTISSSRRR